MLLQSQIVMDACGQQCSLWVLVSPALYVGICIFSSGLHGFTHVVQRHAVGHIGVSQLSIGHVYVCKCVPCDVLAPRLWCPLLCALCCLYRISCYEDGWVGGWMDVHQIGWQHHHFLRTHW